MNFSALSRETVLGRILRLPLTLIPQEAVVPILQGPLRGKRWISGSSNHGCWLGSYEQRKQRIFSAQLRPGYVVFDLGAHVGFYSLLASALVGASGTVIAFEPLPSNADLLDAHVRLNRVSNIRCYRAAVGDRDGMAWFKTGQSTSMGKLGTDGDFEVQTVRLDTLVGDGEIPGPDVVKIDVEGAEFMALQGAGAVLSQYHPRIFLATHGKQAHRDCCTYLTQHGYQLTSITSEGIEDTDELMATSRSPEL